MSYPLIPKLHFNVSISGSYSTSQGMCGRKAVAGGMAQFTTDEKQATCLGCIIKLRQLGLRA